MVSKKLQNVHRICFEAILMTFICALKIELIMFEPYQVKLISLQNLPSDFLTFNI